MPRTGPLIFVTSLALWKLLSPPPETLAELVTTGPPPFTLTVTTRDGYVPPVARESERVHVRNEVGSAEHAHPGPVTVVATKPLGRESWTVTVPDVAVCPALLSAVMV